MSTPGEVALPVASFRIDSSQFDAFAARFSTFQESLRNGFTGNLGFGGNATNTYAQQVALMERQARLARELAEHQADLRASERDEDRALQRRNQEWSMLVQSAKSFSRHIRNAVSQMWSLGGTFSGFGDRFGLGSFAGNAANWRRQAMGIGTSVGEMLAFRTSFGRMIDPDQYLGWVNQMETDVTKQGAAYSLMGHGLTNNTGADAVELLRSVKRLADRTPLEQLGPILQSYGVNMNTEEQRRIKSASPEEFAKLLSTYEAKRAGGPSDKAGEAWQTLTMTLEQAKNHIQGTLIEKLSQLEPRLMKLSDGVVHLFDVFAQSPLAEHAIQAIGDGLDWLTRVVQNGELEKSLDTLFSQIDDIGSKLLGFAKELAEDLPAIGAFFRSVRHFFGEDTIFDKRKTAAEDDLHSGGGFSAYFRDLFSSRKEFFKLHPEMMDSSDNLPPIDRASFQKQLTTLEKQNGLPAGILDKMWGIESGRKLYDVPTSSAGAVGPMQLMPDTAKTFGVDPHDPRQAASGAARYMAQLIKRFKDVDEALAAYNWGPEKVAKDIKEHGSKWRDYLPAETRSYIAKAGGTSQPIMIVLTQSPGVDVNASLAQSAAAWGPS